MKVTSNVSKGMQGLESAKTKKADLEGSLGVSNAKDSAKAGGASKVNLSEEAKHMAKAKEIASNMDVDEAKVERLQKMIDEGNYKTDASAIADRLVDNHLLFPEE